MVEMISKSMVLAFLPFGENVKLPKGGRHADD